MRKVNGIDLFRLLIVFGVCLIHAYGLSGHKYISRMLEPCVVAFAFISGWFGVNFKWRKVLLLCGIGVYCAVVGAALSLSGAQDVTAMHFVQSCFKTYGGFWYLHAYLVMTIFAPMINLHIRAAISPGGGGVIKAILPICFLAYIWSLAGSFGVLLPYVPSTPGLGAFSGLSLIGAYAVARACAETGWLNQISKSWCAVVLVVLSPIAAIRLGAYNSPVALVMAACAFRLFVDVRVEARVGSIVKILSPSLFSIYLLQINGFVFSGVPKLGINPILIGVVIFVGTLVLDVPRRYVGRFVKR